MFFIGQNWNLWDKFSPIVLNSYFHLWKHCLAGSTKRFRLQLLIDKEYIRTCLEYGGVSGMSFCWPMGWSILCEKATFFSSFTIDKTMPKSIHLEIFVEWVVKLVETRYWSKSKKKAFTALKRSTNHSGSELRFKAAPFFARNDFIALPKALSF
jgi:hypothetical protein